MISFKLRDEIVEIHKKYVKIQIEKWPVINKNFIDENEKSQIRNLIVSIAIEKKINNIEIFEKDLKRKVINKIKDDFDFKLKLGLIKLEFNQRGLVNEYKIINDFLSKDFICEDMEKLYMMLLSSPIEKKEKEFLVNLFKNIFALYFSFKESFLKEYDKFGEYSNKLNFTFIQQSQTIEIYKKPVNESAILEKSYNIHAFVDSILNQTYGNDQNNEKYWNAYLYTLLLNVSVCPYCNSQFIYTFNKQSEDVHKPNATVRAELDHLMPKSEYPFRAISIYNLIPSCHTCNSSIKGNKEISRELLVSLVESEELLNVEDLYKFKIKLHDKTNFVDFLLGYTQNFEIEIEYLHEDFEKIKHMHEFFYIKERYQYYKKIISNEIFLRSTYNKEHKHNLNKEFDKSFFEDDKLISRIRVSEEVLGKLKSDIFTQIREGIF